MSEGNPRRVDASFWERALSALALLAAAVLVVLLVVTWAARLPYPYDLEWMEGGMLGHAWRLQQGDGLYPTATADFAPFIYPPGYPGLVALLGLPMGLHPSIGRAVSLLGTLGASTALYFTVHRRNGHTLAALAASTWLGCYAASGAFFDLVRPDGLFLGLLAWSIALAFLPGRRFVIGSALLLVAAFFVKHNAAFFGPALLLGLFLRDPRDAAWFAGASVLPAILGVAALQWSSEGRFLTYLIGVPLSHPVVWERAFPRGLVEATSAMPLTGAMTTLAILAASRARHPEDSTAVWVGIPLITGLFTAWLALGLAPGLPSWTVASLGMGSIGALGAHLVVVALRDRSQDWTWTLGAALAVTAVASSAWMRGHSGGFLNVHLPVFWLAALGAGLWLGQLPKRFRALVPAVFAIQLATQGWTTPFSALTPTTADLDAGESLVRTLRNLEGPVWSPDAVWLPTYAGHAPMAHRIGLWDLEGGPMDRDLDAVRTQISEHPFGAVLRGQQPLRLGLDQHYRLRTRLHHNGALVPKTGWKLELETIEIPAREPL